MGFDIGSIENLLKANESVDFETFVQKAGIDEAEKEKAKSLFLQIAALDGATDKISQEDLNKFGQYLSNSDNKKDNVFDVDELYTAFKNVRKSAKRTIDVDKVDKKDLKGYLETFMGYVGNFVENTKAENDEAAKREALKKALGSDYSDPLVALMRKYDITAENLAKENDKNVIKKEGFDNKSISDFRTDLENEWVKGLNLGVETSTDLRNLGFNVVLFSNGEFHVMTNNGTKPVDNPQSEEFKDEVQNKINEKKTEETKKAQKKLNDGILKDIPEESDRKLLADLEIKAELKDYNTVLEVVYKDKYGKELTLDEVKTNIQNKKDSDSKHDYIVPNGYGMEKIAGEIAKERYNVTKPTKEQIKGIVEELKTDNKTYKFNVNGKTVEGFMAGQKIQIRGNVQGAKNTQEAQEAYTASIVPPENNGEAPAAAILTENILAIEMENHNKQVEKLENNAKNIIGCYDSKYIEKEETLKLITKENIAYIIEENPDFFKKLTKDELNTVLRNIGELRSVQTDVTEEKALEIIQTVANQNPVEQKYSPEEIENKKAVEKQAIEQEKAEMDKLPSVKQMEKTNENIKDLQAQAEKIVEKKDISSITRKNLAYVLDKEPNFLNDLEDFKVIKLASKLANNELVLDINKAKSVLQDIVQSYPDKELYTDEQIEAKKNTQVKNSTD